ncbi:hypothetical protein VDT1_0216 [Vibrio sp. 16]|nr:hypothetical protein VDT1_0216 [Vibrio sp. 16]
MLFTVFFEAIPEGFPNLCRFHLLVAGALYSNCFCDVTPKATVCVIFFVNFEIQHNSEIKITSPEATLIILPCYDTLI